MTITDAIMIFAVICGPILAVVTTRAMDNHAAKNRRQHEIFRDLMRTRAAKISPEHVTALNLVEIEFYDRDKIRNAWQKYMENLSTPLPPDSEHHNGFLLRRDQLFIKLLQEIANQIGFKRVDITDLMTSNYYPQGWQTESEEQRQLRMLLIQVLSGLKPLPIKQVDPNQWNGPFPPALNNVTALPSEKSNQ